MIEPKAERVYNIIFSLFLGIIVVLFFGQLVTRPRVVEVLVNESEGENLNQKGCMLGRKINHSHGCKF